MTAYASDYEKAREIADKRNYAGYYKVEREGYDAIMEFPWGEIIDLT